MNVLPPALISSLEHAPGFDSKAFAAVHDSGEQVTSIRVNPDKPFDINEHFPGAEKIAWCSTGYYLPERPSFTTDPLFHAGAYYVQEASSMFLEEVLRQALQEAERIRVLDLCAAPGGKSTLIQSFISKESLLVSNEVIKTRVGRLTENMMKWGGENVVVTNNDAKDFQRLPGFFDVIVADAPCSGSGLFRKDNEAISEWSLSNVDLCSKRQQRILADVLPALKQNGLLIYSTCSYSTEEDEMIADILVNDEGLEPVELDIKNFPGIIETKTAAGAFGYRFYPDKIKGEGFFIAAFRKTSGDEYYLTGKKIKNEPLNKTGSALVKGYIKDPEHFSFFLQGEEILAFPISLQEELAEMQHALYVRAAGVKIGSIVKNGLLPAHDLAVSGLTNDTFPSLGLPLETALEYLRKNEIKAETDIKGWALINYKGHSLGFAKILPGRINNYYPKELRILNR